ncbi:uroporphyrinogen-III C-methyltransferase [Alteromonas flava]|uniref:uroporphyrinogen-III C-methyltransferase n=1 Tax=Alteromonas flava TaxID=2048003 RepID=UPI000C2924F5|nr:uroporphyrinogen-III C-methyltransferase [Alteromonas flava]
MTDSEPTVSSTALTSASKSTNERGDTSSVINEQEKPSKQSPRTSGLVWFFLGLNWLLLIAAVAAAGWYYWSELRVGDAQVQRNQTAVAQQQALTTQLSASLQANANALDTLIADRDRQEQTSAAAIAQLSEANNTSQAQIGQLRAQLEEVGGRRPSDWLLAEADYLVRMAGRKLWLEGDTRSALMMLSAADARLADLGDPSLLPLRQLLAEDVQNLQQINPVSLTSVALSLSGMLPLIEQLPVDALKLPEPTAGQEIEPLTESVSDWWENLRRTMRTMMDDFISVKHRDQPVEPLMSEKLQWLLKEQLSLTLMQAKSAAMRAEPTLYQQSLQRAMAILIEDFDLENTAVQQFTHALQNLLETDISKTLPQQFKVQQPLEDRLNDRINAAFRVGEQPL